MKKRNPIARIVRLREIREKAARSQMAESQGAEADARRELTEAEERREAAAEVADLLRPAELRTLQLRGIRLHEIVMDATARHAIADQRLSAHREAWRSASQDLESAENLEGRRAEAAAIIARAASERALDDLHVTRRSWEEQQK